MNFLERDERRALKFENKLNSFERPSFDNEAHYKKILEEKRLETSQCNSKFTTFVIEK